MLSFLITYHNYAKEASAMKCVGIIWNCAFEFKNDILETMSKFCRIEDSYTIDLKTDYELFVRTIYDADNIAKWKVDKKVENMSKYQSTSVFIIHFDIDTSATRYHKKKKCLVYSNLQDLKDLVRESYKIKLPFYFFDIIFHCSESQKEYEEDMQIINRFH